MESMYLVREYTYKDTSYGGDSNYATNTTNTSSSSGSNRHVKWSEDNYEIEIDPEPLPDPDLDTDVTLYSMEKSHTRTSQRIKSDSEEKFDYNQFASIPPTAAKSPILNRKTMNRAPSPTIDPRSPSPVHQTALTLPPKTMEVRTPSPKDKIEEVDHSNCKYHSHHLDYKYTPPPVKGPCVACGQYIVGSLVTALDEMWHPECFTCVNCDTILKAYNYVVEDRKQYCKNCHEKLFGPPCSVCHKPTRDNRYNVLNRIWHPNCFCCVECGKKLTPDNFIERLGSPYCKDDYHRLFSPKCCACGLPIKDKAINALNKMWHTHCFKCTHCGIPLEERNFYEKNGKPYCEKDYKDLFHPKCTGCKLPITEGRQITAMGKPWHPECFVCSICVKPLTPETYIEHSGKPYCEYDYHKLFSPKCAGCDTPITDERNKIMAMGKPWHPQCFTCVQCAKQLTPPNFIEKNGLPYCDHDYHKLFSPKCAGCNTPITDGNKIIAMGKPWHPQCFQCTQCAVPLGPNNFFEKNGKPYCENDYHKLFSPKCAGCNTPITDGNKIIAMGKPWHPQCFQCTQCAVPLGPNNFLEKNGKPYCENDYHKLFSPKCAGCNTPITDGNKIIAMGKPWHPQCFQCTQCAVPLGPNNFFEKNGKPYCENDFHKLFSPKCAGCNTPITDGEEVMAKGKPWHPACDAAINSPIIPVIEPSLEKSGRPLLETDFPVMREPVPDCNGCKTPITDGNKIQAMGKPWHPQCFTCTQCAVPLGPNNFFEKNGKPYCENDYHKLFSPKCAGCHTPITDGNFINALGKNWHPQCFTCTQCAVPLGPNNFFEKNGKPYCENDFHKLFSPKCAGCRLPIVNDNFINAMGKNWHPQCFNCTECHKKLDPHHFYEKNGLPYCEKDYNRLFAPPCAGCQLPITDPSTMVQAMGKNWHPQCFNCTECHVPLGPYNFKEKNGKPYCENDYNKLFKPKCAGCEQPILGNKLKAMGKDWHPHCFTCHKCNKPLGPNNYLEKGGKPYCEDDYHKLFSPKCTACNEPIKDKPLIAMGRQWHPHCFKCTECGIQLSPNNFQEKDGKPYCRTHYQQLFLPKCYGCKQPITDQVVKALGKTWHPKCFCCVQCHKPLHMDGYREREGLPYCDTDYHALFSPKCAACNAPIREKCLTAMGKTWHPEHFTCHHCNKQMSEDPEGYHEHNDRAYCRPCYIELFAPYCRACNKPIVDKICVTALDAKWHQDCFVCRDCHCPLKTGNYFEFEGEPYCEEHYRCKMCPDCIKLRRAQNKYFGQPTNADMNKPETIDTIMIKLGA